MIMKKIMMTLATLFVAVCARAQVYIGGGVGFANASDDDDSRFSWKISPEIGYQFNKNWEAGLSVGWKGVEDGAHSFELAPYARYNFCTSKLVDLFLEGTVGYVHSEGVDGYTIDEYDKDSVGTEIILTIKDKTEDEDYDEYLSQWKIKSLVKKYSDYIRYPIMMDMVKTRYLDNDKDDENGNSEPKTEEYIETETLNSMVPIWKKNKSEVTEEEYNSFYKEKFFDYTDPLKSIHVKTEGTATYSALLYIPSKAPFDYYSKNYEKGLQLYSSGVLIMDKCADLLPDHFSFVRGLVDSEDLSLNISRELLQHDRQLKLIAKSLERTIKNELKKMLTNEREKYEEFWKQFGIQVKFGVYNEYGSHKDILKDLLLFTSSMEKKLVTLDEYVSRMKEDQKYIYYASGDTADKIDLLPQIERFKEKGIEVLYLTDSVDEFALKTHKIS